MLLASVVYSSRIVDLVYLQTGIRHTVASTVENPSKLQSFSLRWSDCAPSSQLIYMYQMYICMCASRRSTRRSVTEVDKYANVCHRVSRQAIVGTYRGNNGSLGKSAHCCSQQDCTVHGKKTTTYATCEHILHRVSPVTTEVTAVFLHQKSVPHTLASSLGTMVRSSRMKEEAQANPCGPQTLAWVGVRAIQSERTVLSPISAVQTPSLSCVRAPANEDKNRLNLRRLFGRSPAHSRLPPTTVVDRRNRSLPLTLPPSLLKDALQLNMVSESQMTLVCFC